jgi:hypothetical protein
MEICGKSPETHDFCVENTAGWRENPHNHLDLQTGPNDLCFFSRVLVDVTSRHRPQGPIDDDLASRVWRIHPGAAFVL